MVSLPCFRFLLTFLTGLLAYASLINAQASPPYALITSVDGSGNVLKNPSFAKYPDGAVVTLTGSAAEGWLFSHWSGDLTGNENPKNILMNSPKTVTAHFEQLPSYSLDVNREGQGIVTLNPTGGTYYSNTMVHATATAAEGWVFAGWSGDFSGMNNPASVQMDRNKSITARRLVKRFGL